MSSALVKWILGHGYQMSGLLHSLGGCITAGCPQCGGFLSIASLVFTALDLPLHSAKWVGLTTCMYALGIKLDSVHQFVH